MYNHTKISLKQHCRHVCMHTYIVKLFNDAISLTVTKILQVRPGFLERIV